MNADQPDEKRRFEEHYEGKWRDHRGYWRDYYDAEQQVYASSLYDGRNAAILAAIPGNVRAVLDLGCGLGDLMRLVSVKSDLVMGIDLAEVNVRRTSENLRADGIDNGRAILSRAEALPFKEHAFDAVLMADVIEHTPDVDQVLSEVTRVLRPGGSFICATPHAALLTTISTIDRLILRGLCLLLGKTRTETQRPVFERFLSPSEIKRALDRHGMACQVYRRVCFYPGPEGGGVFQIGMSFLYRHLRRRHSAFLIRLATWLCVIVERAQVLNQKQLWVAKVKVE